MLSTLGWPRTLAAVLGALVLGLMAVGWYGTAIYPEFGHYCDASRETPDRCVIYDVRPGTPSALAGLRVGDAIVAVDGVPAAEAGRLRRMWRIGERVTYSVVRAGPSGSAGAGAGGPVEDVTITLRSRLATPGALAGLTLQTAFGLVILLVGLVVLVRRPDVPAARLLALATGCIALGDGFETWFDSPYLTRYHAVRFAPQALNLLALAAGLHTALVLPEPRGWLKRRPVLATALYILPAAVALMLLVQRWHSSSASLPARLSSLLIPVLLAGIAAALLWTYWRPPTPLARQQVKWFLWVLLVHLFLQYPVEWGVLAVTGARWRSGWQLWEAIQLLYALAAALAITRYRLFDIDRIINRTVVYGALTGALALAYWGGVLALQQVLRPFAWGTDTAVAGATLAVFALFRPVRGWLQDQIDRRFYRRKYVAAQALDAFGARLREQVDAEALRRELIGVVAQTVQPARVSLWLRPPGSRAAQQP